MLCIVDISFLTNLDLGSYSRHSLGFGKLSCSHIQTTFPFPWLRIIIDVRKLPGAKCPISWCGINGRLPWKTMALGSLTSWFETLARCLRGGWTHWGLWWRYAQVRYKPHRPITIVPSTAPWQHKEAVTATTRPNALRDQTVWEIFCLLGLQSLQHGNSS